MIPAISPPDRPRQRRESTTDRREPAEILLVEDTLGDVRRTREAFEDERISDDLRAVTDGQAALDFRYVEDANAYLTRPVSPDAFTDRIRTLEEFWLAVVRLSSTNE
ncbi:hypothetical protein SAMN04489841_3456 [Natrinema salaciae]|uniref:Response regulatory domain-containing protein n=1 Tax=Natrinema salaciae TaxID=1186196 RepID=A0A1H9MQC3_9EURY|nr:hypothetical protein SAMN04489841_3456 [Natrinema salaciae]